MRTVDAFTLIFWGLVILIWFIVRETSADGDRERANLRDEELGRSGILKASYVEKFKYMNLYKAENNMRNEYYGTTKVVNSDSSGVPGACMFCSKRFGGTGFLIVALNVLKYRDKMSPMAIRWAEETLKLWKPEDRPETWETEYLWELKKEDYIKALNQHMTTMARSYMELTPEKELQFLSKKERKKRLEQLNNNK